MTEWNYAAILDAVAEAAPSRVAVVCDGESITFADLTRRIHSLACGLWGLGVRPGDNVALDMVNSPDYLIAFFAALRMGAVPANVNFRYGKAELAYLFDNSDAAAVIADAEFAAAAHRAAESVAARPPVIVPDASGRPPDGCRAMSDVEAAGDAAALQHAPRGDALIFMYTGGTTGNPKAVMWRNDDLYRQQWELNRPGKPMVHPAEAVQAGKRAATAMPCSPLMHGTGLYAALGTLVGGGTVVLVRSSRLDAERVWRAARDNGVVVITIVGDVFARPLHDALVASPDLLPSTLKVISSSGTRFSPDLKRAFLDLIPGLRIVDSLGATEAMVTRSTVSRDTPEEQMATFSVTDDVVVLGDDDEPVAWGSDQVGRIAVSGILPVGYYKDPEKSHRTWPTIRGRRYAVSGDMATVAADGSIHFVGRGSACINSGGEKIYPEEVEDIVKTHPAVRDCAVVGQPDSRWGESVVALVQLEPGHRGAEEPPIEDALIQHVRDHLAAYKAPKRVLVVDSVTRQPNGKIDYARMKTMVAS